MRTALAHDRWTEGRRVLRRLQDHVRALPVWEVIPPMPKPRPARRRRYPAMIVVES